MKVYELEKDEYKELRERLRHYFEQHNLKAAFSAQGELVRVSLKNKSRRDLNKAACGVTP
jgi:hypothetical protein